MNSSLKILVGSLVFFISVAAAQTSIDDTVEDQDIFFDEIPDDGIDFIDELPTEETPEKIYSRKTKKRKKKSSSDVVDKGPKELKQTPQGPAKNLDPDGLFKEKPLFQVEKEEPIEQRKVDTPAEVKRFGETDEGFQFPSAPGAGEADFDSKTATPNPTPLIFPKQETDTFGVPIETPKSPVAQPKTLKEKRRRARTGPAPETEDPADLVFKSGEDLTPSASENNWDDVDVVMKAARSQTVATPHPNAKKGLIRITQDRTYVYRVPRSKQDRAFAFKFGIFDPDQLENPDTGITFVDSYDSTSGPMLSFEYEWQWWRGSLGKLGVKLGSGLFVTEGNGRFKNNFAENGTKSTPEEKFTFVAFPNLAGVIYRAQFSDTQTLVPYGDGGLTAITFAEFRDDKDVPRLGLGYGAFFSGGLAINLNGLDNLSILELDREYGINSIFLTGEFRQIVNLGSNFNFESSVISGGITMEF